MFVPRGAVSRSDEFWKHVEEGQIDPATYDLLLKELAAKAGVSPVTISRVENGLDDPQPATTRKLAAALGVEPADLMEPLPGKGD